MTQSKRSSIHILDLMGEVGGFQEAIFMFIGIFATVVSQRLQQANIAKSYFMKKVSRKDYKKNVADKEDMDESAADFNYKN